MPAGASFDWQTRTLRWTPGGSQPGVYRDVRVIASDGISDTVRSFTITVLPGDLAPEFTQPVDRTVGEGTTLTFDLRATDPEGEDITYTSSNLPSGAILVPDSGKFILDARLRSERNLRRGVYCRRWKFHHGSHGSNYRAQRQRTSEIYSAGYAGRSGRDFPSMCGLSR